MRPARQIRGLAALLCAAIVAAACGSDSPTEPPTSGAHFTMTLLDVTFPIPEYVKCQSGASCESIVIGEVTDTTDAPVNLVDVSGFTKEGNSTSDVVVTGTDGKFFLPWHLVGLGPHTLDVCAGGSKEGSDGCSLVTLAITP